jgi:hypothetical protein
MAGLSKENIVALIGKSYLKPENSIIAGMATVGLVLANYNLHNGSAAQASNTAPMNPDLLSSTKKAGYTSLLLVAGISLIAHDPNVFILGCAAIIAMHSTYIHAIATQPNTGTIAAAAGAAAPLFAAA